MKRSGRLKSSVETRRRMILDGLRMFARWTWVIPPTNTLSEHVKPWALGIRLWSTESRITFWTGNIIRTAELRVGTYPKISRDIVRSCEFRTNLGIALVRDFGRISIEIYFFINNKVVHFCRAGFRISLRRALCARTSTTIQPGIMYVEHNNELLGVDWRTPHVRRVLD